MLILGAHATKDRRNPKGMVEQALQHAESSAEAATNGKSSAQGKTRQETSRDGAKEVGSSPGASRPGGRGPRPFKAALS